MVATTKKNTLLPTAKAKILNEDNEKEELIRVLLDSCPQKSFVNERMSRKLHLLVIHKERMIVPGFKPFNAEPRTIDVVQTKLCCVKQTLTVAAELCVIPKNCSPISCQTIELAQATYEHIIGLDLSDTCSESSNLVVDILIIIGVYDWKNGSWRRLSCRPPPPPRVMMLPLTKSIIGITLNRRGNRTLIYPHEDWI